jgi:hypothetical protein
MCVSVWDGIHSEDGQSSAHPRPPSATRSMPEGDEEMTEWEETFEKAWRSLGGTKKYEHIGRAWFEYGWSARGHAAQQAAEADASTARERDAMNYNAGGVETDDD